MNSKGPHLTFREGLVLLATFVLAFAVLTVTSAGASDHCNANQTSNSNHPCYWEHYFAGLGYENVECSKDDNPSTPYVMPDPPDGREWLALILKAGSGDGENEVIMDPVAGQEYAHDSGKGNSHVIVCSILETSSTPTGTETPSTPPTSTPSPTSTGTPSPTPTESPAITPTPTPLTSVPPAEPAEPIQDEPSYTG